MQHFEQAATVMHPTNFLNILCSLNIPFYYFKEQFYKSLAYANVTCLVNVLFLRRI